MGDTAWKNRERLVAKRLGGKRRGPDTHEGKSDIIGVEGFAIEVKCYARLKYSDLFAACKQAERNAKPMETPIAVCCRKNDLTDDALVVMRFEEWEKWYGPAAPSKRD